MTRIQMNERSWLSCLEMRSRPKAVIHSDVGDLRLRAEVDIDAFR